MVGLRIAGPLLIGSTGFDPWRFGWLNALGATVWAMLFTALGYAVGAGAEQLTGDIERVEAALLFGLLLAGLPLHLAWRLYRRRRRPDGH